MKSEIFTYRNVILLILISANLIIFAKLNFFVGILGGSVSLQDFDNYYNLTKDLVRGVNPYQVSYMRPWGPPLVFIYYLPFQVFDIYVARSLNSIVNIASGVIVCILLSRKLFPTVKLPSFLLLNALFFASFPARFSLEMGQPNLLITLVVTLIVFSENRNIKPFFIALLISLKTYFLLTVFTFLKRDKFLFERTLFFIFFIAFIVSPFLNGKLYLFFANSTIPSLIQGGNTITGTDYYNQSYFSTLARLGVAVSSKNIYPIILILGVFLIYQIRNFEISLIFSLILSIISWQHYFIVLFPIYIKALSIGYKKIYGFVFLSSLLFFGFTEFPWLHNAHLTKFTGILASHYFLSAFLLAIYIFPKERLTLGKNKSYNMSNAS